MRSPVVTITEGMKEKDRIKTKIGVGSLVKAKVRKMEENTREGRSRRTRKEVVGCVEAVVGKKKFLVQFEYGNKIEKSSISLLYRCSKHEVCLEMDEPISDLPQKEQGGLLTIDGDPDVAEPCMYFSVFYCLCYVKDISTDMLEEQVSEERDTDLNEKEDIRMEDSREEHWRDVSVDDEDNNKIHALKWDIYTR